MRYILTMRYLLTYLLAVLIIGLSVLLLGCQERGKKPVKPQEVKPIYDKEDHIAKLEKDLARCDEMRTRLCNYGRYYGDMAVEYLSLEIDHIGTPKCRYYYTKVKMCTDAAIGFLNNPYPDSCKFWMDSLQHVRNTIIL